MTISARRKALSCSVLALGLAMAALPGAAGADEWEVSLYGGNQTAAASRATGRRADGSGFSSLIHWDGKSFSPPPYYGARAIRWRESGLGWGVEMTHAKVYAPAGDRPAGFTRMEFTDGHNILTANVMKRWPGGLGGRATPYIGAGLGLAIPHVDVTENGNRTYGYQLTGPAVKLLAGLRYDLGAHWALFGEYQATWTDNEADLAGGGSLSAEVTMQAVNFGVSYRF